MKIREIFELNKEKPMSLIAKEDLPAGEKKVYEILKSIGAETPAAFSREWTYENVSETDLDKDLSEFITRTANNKQKASNINIIHENKKISQIDMKTNNDSDIENEMEGIARNEVRIAADQTAATKEKSKQPEVDNRMKDEIANMLNGIEPQKPEKHFMGFYLDKDVASVIKRIRTGNKSEFVSKIIRAYLKDNDLL